VFEKESNIDPEFRHHNSILPGAEQLFDRCFRDLYPALCKFARTYLKEEEASADLVQECFLKLWERGNLVDHTDHLQSFLYSIVRNKCIDVLRRKSVMQKRVGEYTYLANQWGEDEIGEVIRSETTRQLYAALEELPEDIREVVKRHYFNGEGYSAIAVDLNTTYSTVAQRRDRAVKILKRSIQRTWILFSTLFS
jgi:RNA polymerase sigma-70 factor (family 1)